MQTIDCRTGLGVLGRQGCLRCLASHPLGRVAVLVNGWPMIFPVNHHVVDSDTIVFRSDEVSKLAGVGGGLCMSLETDGIDDAGRLWSVSRARARTLRAWARNALVADPARVDHRPAVYLARMVSRGEATRGGERRM
jgi:Pyridoxamine 5'-phosphate oxidase